MLQTEDKNNSIYIWKLVWLNLIRIYIDFQKYVFLSIEVLVSCQDSWIGSDTGGMARKRFADVLKNVEFVHHKELGDDLKNARNYAL